MFKEFITWTEAEPVRIRKIVLLLILVMWIFVTLLFTLYYLFGKPLDGLNTYYLTVCGALGTAYGFYTATSAVRDDPVLMTPSTHTDTSENS
jgi:hypothetical protein